jgi:ferrous iron transport protein A
MNDVPIKITLDELKTGERAILLEINTGHRAASRMSTLGFTPGVEVEMNQNYGHGPLLVTVRGTRVALGRQEARGLQVERNIA